MNIRSLTAITASLLLISGSLPLFAQCVTTQKPTAPASRFIDNGNDTISDKATGLIWMQCTDGLSTSTSACDTGIATLYSWQQALQQATSLNANGGFAGKTNWRLPNEKELASILELSCVNPAINESLFPNTSSNLYWSSSPGGCVIGRAQTISFQTGEFICGITNGQGTFPVRLVSDG